MLLPKAWPLAIGIVTAAADRQLILEDHGPGLTRPLNIAIIGAGAAGSSSAYHLAKFGSIDGLPINITIFEQNTYIGGRSTTIQTYNSPLSEPVELGASIFVQVNHILVDAVREFNLSTSNFRSGTKEIPGAALAVWDGEEFVVTQYGSSSWWDTTKLLWKYGLAPIRTIRLMKATVAKFLKMYEGPIFPFLSITQAVQEVGLLSVTAATGEQFMLENGITGDFGHDVVQASTRVNYAQNLRHIHGLEAMVCMATDGAMAVEGGNWRIFDHMIRKSHATQVLGRKVTRIQRQDDGTFQLTSKSTRSIKYGDMVSPSTKSFDAVIVAAPFQYASIDFHPPLENVPDEIPYVELHVTLFTSPHLLSPQYFGFGPSSPAPRVILTTLPKEDLPSSGPEGCGKPGFWSISILRTVTNPKSSREEYLYKVFSPTVTNDTFIAQILGVETDDTKLPNNDVTWLHRKVWNSYPYEHPRVTFESVQLGQKDDGSPGSGQLWYTGGIESFISTMETSTLMGKNVARLLVDRWNAKIRKTGNSSVDGIINHGDSL